MKENEDLTMRLIAEGILPNGNKEVYNDMYEALKGLVGGIHTLFFDEFDKSKTVPYIEGYKEAVLALSKAEEK